MFHDEKKHASSSSAGQLSDKQKREQAIHQQMFTYSTVKKNQYVKDSLIVTRCDAWASMTVNGEKVATTSVFTSGAKNRWPGANWTGIMSDIGDSRYSVANYRQAGNEDEDAMRRLLTCSEGKCLFDLMSRNVKKDYFKKTNKIKIEIEITFDEPCYVCHAALNDWAEQYVDMCDSFDLIVHGKAGSYTYPS